MTNMDMTDTLSSLCKPGSSLTVHISIKIRIPKITYNTINKNKE